jgi:hypothetical protein
MSEDRDIYNLEKFEPLTRCTKYNVGWMKILWPLWSFQNSGSCVRSMTSSRIKSGLRRSYYIYLGIFERIVHLADRLGYYQMVNC